ncbi:LysR substrate-binding domain-containing protein [Motilimonas cestriensis]|uniref:LysR family transcriptional regulator n=1 Tax=Motilimonas cestriensis TaxID=2742685 RepID=UPI003DA541A1
MRYREISAMQKAHKRFERYHLFSEVAETLNFAKAAENLGISRSYLSTQISTLEKELAVSLLIRTTRHVKLTAAGHQVLQKMRQINASVANLEKGLNQVTTDVTGQISITAPMLFSQRYLLPLCARFQQQYPGITFDLNIGYQNENLACSRFDFAIRATNTPPENMVAKKLLSYQHICCASPEYLAKNGRPVTPLDLTHHSCLSDPNLTLWHFEQQNDQYDVDTHGTLQINDNMLLIQAALQGQGIIKLPDFLLNPLISQDQLIQVLPEFTTLSRDIYLLFPHQANRSAKLRAFIEHVSQFWQGGQE